MANTKISALTNGNPAQSGDLIPIARSGANFSVTAASIAAQLPNSTDPSNGLLPSGLTQVNAFGDSITSGQGLQGGIPSMQAWGNVFAKALGLPVTNKGLAGADFSTVVGEAYQILPALTSASVSILGSNDVASGTNVATVISGYQAFATWLSLPAANKAVIGGGITTSGSWSTFTEFHLQGVTSTTLNDTATATVTGSTIYVGNWADSGVTDHFDILVDGVSQGPFTQSSPGGIVAQCIRLTGFSAGSHTVVVKVITNGQTATVQWIGGTGSGGPYPFVGIGNCIPRQLQDPTAFNTALATMVSTLQGDGLNVHLFNTNSAIALNQTPNLYQGDQTHPNQLGEQVLASYYLTQCFNAASFPAAAGKNGDALAQILADGGITPEVLAATINSIRNTVPVVAASSVGNSLQTTDGVGNLTSSQATANSSGSITLPSGQTLTTPIIVESATLSPTSSGTAGVTGQIAWDSGKIYVCTAGGGVGAATWKAATLTGV
jgi:lysophospholipase L1-like esterase